MKGYGNKSARWNADLHITFLNTHFGSRNDMSRQVLLLLDSFSGHWSKAGTDYTAEMTVVLLKILPCHTLFQPADVTWVKPFKG